MKLFDIVINIIVHYANYLICVMEVKVIRDSIAVSIVLSKFSFFRFVAFL